MGTTYQWYNVTSATIGRWLKRVMTSAGINTHVFKPHSSRSASTSAAARAGLSVQDILRTAGWSNAGTFEKFYHKEVVAECSRDFGGAVLGNTC